MNNYTRTALNLSKIIRETPIRYFPMKTYHIKNDDYISVGGIIDPEKVHKKHILKGITTRLPYRKLKLDFLVDKLGLTEFYIGLNEECYNIEDVLIHEACHVLYPNKSEKEIEKLSNIMSKYKRLNKYARKKIRETMLVK